MLRYILAVLLLLAASPALAQQEMRSSTKGASTPLPITGSVIDADHNAIDVKCLSGCAGGGGGGGTSATDDAAFTPGTDAVTPAGFMFDDVAPASVHEGDIGVGRMSANRNQYTTIRDSAGNERGLNIDANGEIGIGAIRSALPAGTNAIGKLSANSGVDIGDVDITSIIPGTAAANLGKAEDAVHTTGDTGVAIWAKRTDTPASSGADGDYVTINSDASGYLYTIPRSSGSTGAAPPDRASYSAGLGSGATGGFLTGIPVSDTFKSVSVTSATTTLLITGVSGRHIRIGSINLVSAIANNVALISGTGATCGTGTTGVAGGTTAANGWNLAANAGLAYGNGLGTIMRTTATGDSICVVTSAIGPLAGTIGYAIY